MTIIDDDDLVAEILLRLPAKSLIGFKLVCKRWFCIISSHHFSTRHALRHHGRSKPEPSLLLRLAETPIYIHLQCEKWVSYHFSPTLIEPTIMSVSNGLFLLQCRNVENPIEDCHIYNPTTKQSRKILLNENERYRSLMGLNLAFDPLVSPHYKIICVRATKMRASRFWGSGCRRFQVEVFKSDDCTWELSGEPFVAPQDSDFSHGIYWKGGIHWCEIFFNLHDSSIGKHPEVVFPRDIGEENFRDNYVESNGSLHYMAHFTERGSVMVFELQSDFSQWWLKYHVNIDRALVPISVLSIVRGDIEEDCMLVLHEPGKIKAYMIQEESVNEIIDFREESFYKENCIQFVSRCTFQFIETLASV